MLKDTIKVLLFMFLPHRGRVCYLTSEHSSYLWLHQRTPGHHPARVGCSFTYKIVSSVPHTLNLNHWLLLFSLQTNYTEDSLTWDFMAKRELEAPGAGAELQSAKGRASDINRREQRCCQVYEEGIKSVSTGGSAIHRTHTHDCFTQTGFWLLV